MTLETALYTLLKDQCPRVFPDVAPFDTPRPYVVWQQIGGAAPVYVEGEVPGQRNAYVQITAWDDTRAAANALSQQIEAALVRATTLQAVPQGALQAAHDGGTDRRGAMQDFDIWAVR
jgi:hypothetical protein